MDGPVFSPDSGLSSNSDESRLVASTHRRKQELKVMADVEEIEPIVMEATIGASDDVARFFADSVDNYMAEEEIVLSEDAETVAEFALTDRSNNCLEDFIEIEDASESGNELGNASGGPHDPLSKLLDDSGLEYYTPRAADTSTEEELNMMALLETTEPEAADQTSHFVRRSLRKRSVRLEELVEGDSDDDSPPRRKGGRNKSRRPRKGSRRPRSRTSDEYAGPSHQQQSPQQHQQQFLHQQNEFTQQQQPEDPEQQQQFQQQQQQFQQQQQQLEQQQQQSQQQQLQEPQQQLLFPQQQLLQVPQQLPQQQQQQQHVPQQQHQLAQQITQQQQQQQQLFTQLQQPQVLQQQHQAHQEQQQQMVSPPPPQQPPATATVLTNEMLLSNWNSFMFNYIRKLPKDKLRSLDARLNDRLLGKLPPIQREPGWLEELLRD